MKNNDPIFRFFLLLLVCALVSQSAYAQKSNKRYSEADIKAEEQFIEADALFLKGKHEEAVEKFKAFILDFPEVAMAHFQLGRAYNALKETNKSIASIEQAIELDNQNRWFNIELAKVYESNGQANLAAKVMVDLTKVEPKKDFAYKKAAFYFLLSDKPNEAIYILAKAEKNLGFDAEIAYRTYVIFMAQGETQKGIESLQKILNYHPKDSAYRLELADTYLKTKKPALAEKEYRRVLEFDPYNAQALVALQKRKVSMGDKDSQGLLDLVKDPSIGIDLKIVELVPIIQKATTNSSADKQAEWISLIKELINVHPTDAKAYSVAGDLYYSIGKNDLALQAYKKTLTKEKNIYPVWQQVVELLFIEKQYDEVIETANKALDYFPNKAKLVLFMAEAQYRKGAVKQALSDYQQAGFMSGRNHHQKRFVFARLSALYIAQDQSKKAQKYFEKATKLDDINDPHLAHLKKEIKQQKLIPYSGNWLEVFPLGVLLK